MYTFGDSRSITTSSNMKLIIALCIFALAAAAPPMDFAKNHNDVGLLRYDKDTKEDGTYSFSYEQTDGQRREEQGQMRKTGLDVQSLSVKGSYHWVGPDGVDYTIIYIADENGYKPEIQQGPGGAVSPQIASMLG